MELERLTVKTERTPLDLFLWRKYRRDIPGLVEATFKLNYELALQGEYLHVGTVIEVPEPPKQKVERQLNPVISLFD